MVTHPHGLPVLLLFHIVFRFPVRHNTASIVESTRIDRNSRQQHFQKSFIRNPVDLSITRSIGLEADIDTSILNRRTWF